MYTCENHHCPGDCDHYEEEQKAVRHAEDGKREVVVVLDPVVAAAEEAEGEGEGACELAVYDSTV